MDVRALLMAWRLRVRMLRLLQIDSKEKQELLYIGTAAPALWHNRLFLNHISNSIAGKLDIKLLISNDYLV